jgi:predicted branched-subunit amino acid permease
MMRGARDMAGTLLPVAAFGIAFGAAAVATGMSLASATAMSALVFAGASQFAALDVWSSPLPFLALAVVTVAINSRHIVLGATLHGLLAPLPRWKRHAAVLLLSDANWAATQQSAARGSRDAGHLIGGGAVMWLAWVAGTWIGAAAGGLFGDLERFGVPWIVAAVATWGASYVVPDEWVVLLGALAGAVFGAISARR